ncbi:RNA polymerase sigma factor [Lachnoclostridium phytofermentans]|jgi:RNA polymerase sigma-70 factor (ECF subfamily)|uniref:RNA polymerase sigma factor n=1 Tax=Lachnoclostridium phytofermentans TaxID=66219 RepID=UPI000691B893|nr:sigma-70 family RNA polymerase sigma factor [Lachnoclostridium phytofermentans]
MNNPEYIQPSIDLVISKYSDLVYKLACCRIKNKYDAEDIFQEVFLQLIKYKTKFTGEEHLKAWLIRVTINCCNKHFLSLKNSPFEIITEDLVYLTPEESEVYQAVLSLHNKYRTVIHLFYYEELSIKQISDVLGKKEGTIKSLLARGRNLLKNKLLGSFSEESEINVRKL